MAFVGIVFVIAFLAIIITRLKESQAQREWEQNAPEKSAGADGIPGEEQYTTVRLHRCLFDADYMHEGLGTLQCRNGIAYLYRKNDKNPFSELGSYKYTDDNRCAIIYANTYVGFVEISTNVVYFDFTEMYNKRVKLYKDNGWFFNENSVRNPDKFQWRAVKISVLANKTGIIRDFENGELIAEFCGDPVEAAAAFVCWVNEIGDNTKYGEFFSFNAP